MSNVSPDIRPNCNGGRVNRTLGGCWQNADAADSTTRIKYNVTEMFHYTSSQPTYIPPYVLANLTTEACSPYSTTSYPIFECGDYTNGNLYCYPIPTTYMHGSGSNPVSFSVGLYNNYYSQSNDTASNPCGDNRALGFKNCYAKKTWSGRKAFTSPDHGKPDDWDWCCGCSEMEARSNDPTKYLTLTANSVYTVIDDVLGYPEDVSSTYFNCEDPPVEQFDGVCRTYPDRHTNTYTGTANATSTVNQYGQITVASCESASASDFSEVCADDPDCIAYLKDAIATAANNLLTQANGNWNELITQWCAKMTGAGGFSDITGCEPDVVTHVGDGAWHVEWHSGTNAQPSGGTCVSTLLDRPVDGTYAYCDVIPTEKKLYYEMDISPTQLEIKIYDQKITFPECTGGDTTYEWVVVSDKIWAFGATSFTFESTEQENTYSINWERVIHEEITAALSSPYTAQEVYTDLVDNLISQWNMGTDMPWRSDSRKTIGPLVSRKETTNFPYIGNCNITTSAYTGEILGKPGPEGIDRIWDVSHENWCTCIDIDPDVTFFYIQDYGAWSTDTTYGCGVPRATQWTTFFDTQYIPDGAFVRSIGDILFAGKYAESIFSKQSFNYARPCGKDFLQLSNVSKSCISSVSGLVVSFDATGPTNLIASGSKVWVCGGSAGVLDGLWTVSSAAAHSVTLQDPRIASASQFPTNPIDNCGTGIVAALRWPNLTDKICGRVGITSVTSGSAGGVITASLDTATYLITGDSVTVIDSEGMNGTHTIKVIDNATITLDGTSGPAQAGGQIYSPFGADWKWNSNNSITDFVYYKWDYGSNTRDWGEYNRIVAANDVNADMSTSTCEGTHPCGFYATVPSTPPVITSSATTTCINISPCSSATVYFSPSSNTESFANNINLGWSPGIEMDSIYYSGIPWSAIVKQSMNDPYFQAPPCRCEHDYDCDTEVTTHDCISTWEEDSGNCVEDVEPSQDCDNPELSIAGKRYYPAIDQYEARSTLPLINGVEAPSLVGGATLPTSIAQPTSPDDHPNEVSCYPYICNVVEAPWITLLAKEQCVCNSGRFAENYISNGITGGPQCPMFVLPP